MNTPPHINRWLSLLIASVAALSQPSADAQDTWDGGGGDNLWGTGNNWADNSSPTTGTTYDLTFAGGTRLSSVYNYGDGNNFRTITFDNTAGAFTIYTTNTNDSNSTNFNERGISWHGNIINNDADTQTLGIRLYQQTSNQIRANSGNIVLKGDIFQNGNTLTITGTNNKTVTVDSVINNGSSAGKVIVGSATTDNTTLLLTTSNNYSGNSEINAGTLATTNSTGFGTSTVFVGNGGASFADTSAALMLNAGGITVSNSINVNDGSDTTRIIGGSVASGQTATYSGTVVLDNSDSNDVILTSNTDGGTIGFNRLTDTSANTVLVRGPGIVSFAGTGDNTNLGATVGDGTNADSGTLLLNKTSNVNDHAVGAGLTINNGGTAALGNSTGDQIFSGSAVTVNNGGTFRTGGFSEGSSANGSTPGVGALTLAGGADFFFSDTTNGNTFSASSLTVTGSGEISIFNWTGTLFADSGSASNDRLLFQGATPTAGQLAMFQFYNDAGAPLGMGAGVITFNGFNELVPVPEPSTWIGGVLAFGAVCYSQRRRFRGLLKIA